MVTIADPEWEVNKQLDMVEGHTSEVNVRKKLFSFWSRRLNCCTGPWVPEIFPSKSLAKFCCCLELVQRLRITFNAPETRQEQLERQRGFMCFANIPSKTRCYDHLRKSWSLYKADIDPRTGTLFNYGHQKERSQILEWLKELGT